MQSALAADSERMKPAFMWLQNTLCVYSNIPQNSQIQARTELIQM